jgi:hypothetical protein
VRHSINLQYYLVLVFFTTACEYEYTNTFVVRNNLNKPLDANLASNLGESAITLSANEVTEILTSFGGIGGRDYNPGDRRAIKWQLDSPALCPAALPF